MLNINLKQQTTKMLNQFNKGLLLSFILCISTHGYSQLNELKDHLSTKENKKITSAERLITKGDDIIDKVSHLEDEVEDLKNTEGRIKTHKINKRNKQIAQAKMKAAVFYEDGYNKHIKLLDKRIKTLEKEGNSSANKTRDEVKALKKKAKKQYNKSERLTEPADMIEMLELARENQNKAIEAQVRFLQSALSNEPKPEDADEIVNNEPIIETTDTITSSNEIQTEKTVIEPVINDTITPVIEQTTMPSSTTAVAGAVAASAAAISAETQAVPEELKEKPVVAAIATPKPEVTEFPAKEVKDVFLSIQILADKTKASETQIKQAYSGSLPIIEKTGDGWYRYSVGQFTNVATARETMQKEGIKGFIVAYNKNQRITVKEALEMISE